MFGFQKYHNVRRQMVFLLPETKADFGASFKYVPYVECLENTKQCLDLGIQGYPTWIIPSKGSGQVLDGEKLVGYQGLEKLAEASGCKL